MDPFTIALATFGVQKLRGKSTKRAFRDAAIAGGIGQFAGMAGVGPFQAFGQTSLPGMTGNFLTGSTMGQQFGATTAGKGLSALYGKPPVSEQAARLELGEGATKAEIAKRMAGSGFSSFSPGAKLGIGLGAMSLFEDEDKVEMPEGTRPEDYKEAKEKADKQLENILESYDYEGEAAGISPYSYQQGNSLFTFNKGGIAEVKKFNQGGINYLPSKIDHDEHDANNYVRAAGYVEDGSGNGDKDEDTMLAQLADGEFVSRADAILGAGIMEGADPKSYKDMRKKGAAFFYGQQAKFKRIFDLLDAAKEKAN
jgi:hypothetical protein